MNHFRIFVRLAAIMTGVCIMAVGLTTYFLYLDEMSQFQDRLMDSAHRIKRHIESVVEFNTEHVDDHIESHGITDRKEYVREKTIEAIKRARSQPGQTGDIEVTIAYLENDLVEWVSQSHRDEILYVPIPMGHDWAIPMQLALRGGSSVINSIDYAGEKVVAAYTYVSSIGIGVVAKSPVRNIQTRFIKGAMIAVAPAFGIVIIGVFFFIRLTSPVIQRLEINNALQERDKEETKKAQKALEESEHRFRCFYEGAFEGIAITADGKMIDVNDHLLKMYGYRREELIGKEIKHLVLPEDVGLVMSNIKKEERGAYKHRGVASNGSTLYVEVRGRRTLYHGRPVRVTAIHDLTASREAAETITKLNEQQRQVSKMEAIGNFASGIAHDFNNALTPIIGNCDIILNDIGSRDRCQVHRKNILSVLAGAETASLLVHRMQSFVTSGVSTNELQALSLPGCLKEAFDFLRSMTPASIKMRMSIAPALHVVAATDVTIRQILMNVCKNAAQATRGDRGEIIITADNDEVQVERFGIAKGKYVKIEIEDNGRGMSPDILERALDPYFTTKKLEDGTGIGLSVVNGIVASYGGFLRLYSEVGRGSRVVIFIPALVDDEGVVEECKIYKPIPMGNEERILLVDDEDLIISSSTAILESLNYVVTAFNSSIAALEELQEHPEKYDLLLTDLTMPEMTGLILIKEVQKIKPSIKIVLCSGLGSNGKYAKELFGPSQGAYITKPVTRRGYGEVLSKILKGG